MEKELKIKFRNILSTSKLSEADQDKFLIALEKLSQTQRIEILMTLKSSPLNIPLIWQVALKRADVLKGPQSKEEKMNELFKEESKLLEAE